MAINKKILRLIQKAVETGELHWLEQAVNLAPALSDEDIIDTFKVLTKINMNSWNMEAEAIERDPFFDPNRRGGNYPLGVLGAAREIEHMQGRPILSSTIDRLWQTVDDFDFSVPVRRVMLVITDELIDPDRTTGASWKIYHEAIDNRGGNYAKDWRGVTFYFCTGESHADYEVYADNWKRIDKEPWTMHPWQMIWYHRGKYNDRRGVTSAEAMDADWVKPYKKAIIEFAVTPTGSTTGDRIAAELGISHDKMIQLLEMMTNPDHAIQAQGRELFELIAEGSGVSIADLIALDWMDVSDSQFISCTFTDMDIRDVVWERCKFEHCRFIGTSFHGLHLMQEATFDESAFFRVETHGMDLKDVQMNDTTVLKSSSSLSQYRPGYLFGRWGFDRRSTQAHPPHASLQGARASFSAMGRQDTREIYTYALNTAGLRDNWEETWLRVNDSGLESTVVAPKIMQWYFGAGIGSSATDFEQRTAGIIDTHKNRNQAYQDVIPNSSPLSGSDTHPTIYLSSSSMTLAAAIPGMTMEDYFRACGADDDLDMYGEGDNFWRPNHSLLDDAWMITSGYKEHFINWSHKPRSTSLNPYPQEAFFSRMKKHVINQFDWVLALKDEIDAGVDVHGNPEWRYPALGHLLNGDLEVASNKRDWPDHAGQPNVLIKYFLVEVNYGTAIRMTWGAKFKRVDAGDFLFIHPTQDAPDFSSMQRTAFNGSVWNLLQEGSEHWEETLDWSTGIPLNNMNEFFEKYVSPEGDQATLPTPDEFDDMLAEWVTSDEEYVRELAEEDVEYNHPDVDPDSDEFGELVDEQMEIQLSAKREEAEMYSKQWRRVISEASQASLSGGVESLEDATVAPITEMLNILRRYFDAVSFDGDDSHTIFSSEALEMLNPENDGGLSSREGDQLLAEMRADKSTYTYLDKMPEVFILQPENFKLWTPDVWSVRRLRAGYHNKQF